MWSKEETDRLSHSDNVGWAPLKSHSFIQIYRELGAQGPLHPLHLKEGLWLGQCPGEVEALPRKAWPQRLG